SADGSVGSPHARVGHRQALIPQKTQPNGWVFCCAAENCRRDHEIKTQPYGWIFAFKHSESWIIH
ncbi:hypothetical protein, partial [Vreelandella aquamarina]|uniref:hypothetical protein n=1 Tax=Vreelandella aquamarina TaxID=77097 RepID=UPI001D187905